jgi:hypothetical protein
MIQWTPIPCLLKQICNQKETGCLSFIRDDQFKNIYFIDGAISTVESSFSDEGLIELMYRGGLLAEDNLELFTQQVESQGWGSREVTESVDQTTQKWWLRTQIREVLLSLFEWMEGGYSFARSKKPPDSLPVVAMDTLKLLDNLINRIQNLDILVNLIGGYRRVLRVNMETLTKPSAPTLTPQDGFYLSRIDGKMNIRDILIMGGSQKLEMARSFIRFLLEDFLEFDPESEKRLLKQYEKTQIFYASEPLQLEEQKDDSPAPIPEADETPDEENRPENGDVPVKETDREMQELYPSEEVVLTTEELRDLRLLAKNLGSDFLDLAKAMHIQQGKGPDTVDYDTEISYQRGEKFVDGRLGGVDIDGLDRIVSDGELTSLEDDERIAYIIDGKVVDGETDLFGAGFSKDLFEIEDEEEQWNMWMVSEEELSRDFDKDWTSTWTDWVENTGELTTLQHSIEKMEAQLKKTADDKVKEKLLVELRQQSADFQDVIRKKKREMFSIHRRMQFMTYYELLRVERDAVLEDIEFAYRQWETHLLPDDAFIREFSSMAPQIAQIVDMMKAAYTTLSDPEKRKQYDAELVIREQSAEEMKKKKHLLAEQHFLSARTANRRGDKMLAMRFIRGCISLDPGKALYFHEMALLLAENLKWRREALRFFHRAYHLDPDNLDILIEVADLANQLEMGGFAIKALKQVIKQDPDNARAKRLLRKIELTR